MKPYYQICMLLGALSFSQSVSSEPAHYVGYEAFLVSYESKSYINSRIFLGSFFKQPSIFNPNWQDWRFGYELGASGITASPYENVHFRAWGLDGFWTAQYHFMPQWRLIIKGGINAVDYKFKYQRRRYNYSEKSFKISPTSQLGISYNFKNGLEFGISLNHAFHVYAEGIHSIYGSAFLKYNFK